VRPPSSATSAVERLTRETLPQWWKVASGKVAHGGCDAETILFDLAVLPPFATLRHKEKLKSHAIPKDNLNPSN
jgi:hypothetical protein